VRRLAAVPVLSVLAVGVAVPAQAAVETDFFTFLRASDHFPGARGNSEYERQGTGREVEVTVTRIASLAGRRVSVRVNGHKVGTMRVSSRGRAHREWSTAHGQSVPSASAGSPVRVRTAGGTLIVSGRYKLEPDSD
jgi:hypothetical protein